MINFGYLTSPPGGCVVASGPPPKSVRALDSVARWGPATEGIWVAGRGTEDTGSVIMGGDPASVIGGGSIAVITGSDSVGEVGVGPGVGGADVGGVGAGGMDVGGVDVGGVGIDDSRGVDIGGVGVRGDGGGALSSTARAGCAVGAGLIAVVASNG